MFFGCENIQLGG